MTVLPDSVHDALRTYRDAFEPTNQAQRDARYCLDLALITRNVVAARCAARQAAWLALRAGRMELAEQGFMLEERICEVEEAHYAT